jgi:hypothetical protein
VVSPRPNAQLELFFARCGGAILDIFVLHSKVEIPAGGL